MLRPSPSPATHSRAEAGLHTQAPDSMSFFASVMRRIKAELSGRMPTLFYGANRVHVPEVLVMNGVVVPGTLCLRVDGLEPVAFNRSSRGVNSLRFHS